MIDIDAFVRNMPKTDLHVHLEGSIEPELMVALAARNGITLRLDTPDALRRAYEFQNLQSFLDLYFEGCKVIVTEEDFYDVTQAYLRRAHEDGVIRAKLFVGPQSFTERGTPVGALMSGILRAIDEARQAHSMSVGLMISVHRHRTEADAIVVLDQIMPWKDSITGIGMGGAEVGNRLPNLLASLESPGSAVSARPFTLERRVPLTMCVRRSSYCTSTASTMATPAFLIPIS